MRADFFFIINNISKKTVGPKVLKEGGWGRGEGVVVGAVNLEFYTK